MAGIKPNKLSTTEAAVASFVSVSIKRKDPAVISREEDELQIAVTTYVQLQYKHLFYFHPANERKVKRVGKKQIPLEGIILKKKGVKKGLADCWFMDSFTMSGVTYKGLILELKALGCLNDTSIEQEQCLQDLEDRGFFCQVVDNFNDAKIIIDRCYKHQHV